MNFWKLVAAIVVGNLLTGLVAVILWLLLLASLFASTLDSSTTDQNYDATAIEDGSSPAPIITNTEELRPEMNAIPSDAYLNMP